jgi:hypothetical protein
MTWLNFLVYPLEKLRLELLLLVSALAWVLLRLFRAVVVRVENGKPLTVKVLGVSLVEVKADECLLIRQGRGKILHVVASDIPKTVSLMSSELTEKHASLKKVRQSPHSNAKEVGIKW